DDSCEKCDDCVNDPGKLYCNITCSDTSENCHESHKVFNPHIYAKAFIKLQPYENLFDINDAFKAGTVFKDLYSPYCDVKYIGGVDK
ncbi:spore coat associated protein CotJA, partial [Clostridium perfringens]|uniref:spore coat associated protein CotJA n=1 Tax=Clostridium perfringens TaxID=1502 RepID=UPI002ACC13B3